jgi:hypothetical protein
MDPRIAMFMMQVRMREQMQLEMQMRMQMEVRMRQNMTEEQRARITEQQRMRMMMMMAAQQQQILAAQHQQMLLEHMRMASNGAAGPIPPIGMAFPRGPLFSPGHMGDPEAGPANRPRTDSPDGRPDSTEPIDTDSTRDLPRRAGVRNGRPGVVYGEWEVEDLADEK